MSEWISVKERLPEFGAKVLIRLRVINSIQTARLKQEGQETCWRINNAKVTTDSATHWMPLPELPK